MANLTVEDVNERLRAQVGVPSPPPPKPLRGELSVADVNARLSALHATGQGADGELPEPFIPQAITDPLQSGTELALALPNLMSAFNAGQELIRLDDLDRRIASETTAAPGPHATTGLALGDLGPQFRETLRSGAQQELESSLGPALERFQASRSFPRNPASVEMLKAETFGEAWAAFTSDPIGVITQVGLESLPLMVPGIALAAVGSVGGIVPAAAGLGMGSGAVEFAASILEGLARQGVDTEDMQALQAALADPEIMGDVEKFAMKRAAAIGLFDAASLGVASRTLAPKVLENIWVRQAINIPAQLSAQAALGAAGEAGGQLVTTGRIEEPGAVLAEAAGEMIGAPAEISVAALAAERDRSGRRPTPARDVAGRGTAPEPAEPVQATPTPETAPAAPQPPPVAPDDTTAAPPPLPPAPAVEAATIIRVGFDEPPLKPGPKPKPQGDATKGQIGKGVPRSPVELERQLDRFAREGQFGQGITPAIRQRANRLRQETDEALAGLAAQARGFGEAEAETAATEAVGAYAAALEMVPEIGRSAFIEGFTDGAMGRRNKLRNAISETRQKALLSGRLTPYEDAYNVGQEFAADSKPTGGTDGAPQGRIDTVALHLRTATGHEVKFNLPNDAAVIEDFRKRLVGKPRKFFASTPSGGPKGDTRVPAEQADQLETTAEGRREVVSPGFEEQAPVSPGGKPGTGTLSVEQVNQRIRSAPEGSRYVSFAPDRVEGTTPEQPIRREDVLRPLLTALGVPLYQGRIKGRKTLGFYRRHIEEVRIKRMNDLEVTAHEIAHMLDDRIPEIRQQWLPATNANKVIRDELRGVSYDRSKIYEGFAEFVRLWATQPQEAQTAAPRFFGWFEDFVARNEHGPVLRKAQADMTAWYGQDALSRARSKIGVTEEINAGLTSVWDRLRQSVADDLHGIMA